MQFVRIENWFANWFQTKVFNTHALIHLTGQREQLDKGNFACGTIVYLQKAFEIVDHDILIQQFNHYDIRGVANNWFSSYLQNRSQYVSINDFNSNLEYIHCSVPQGSVLGQFLFLIYINDINCAIRYCSVHHFADDTNLLNYNNSVKRMNKKVNQDLKNLTNWLNANKICLSVSKTAVVLFKSLRKLTDVPLKLKLNRKRLYPTNSVKYLGRNIDENLTGNNRLNKVDGI